MIIQENKLTIDHSILSEFCKVVERSVSDSKFIYFSFENNSLLLYAEGAFGYCYFKEFVQSDSVFHVGIEASKFFSMVKKLYAGDVHLTIEKNAVLLQKDNISAKFPVSAGRIRQSFFDDYMFIGQENEVKFITNSLIDSHVVDESKGLNKFSGVLFETKDDVSRICKFSGQIIYISSFSPIRSSLDPKYGNDYRITFPELIVHSAKQFNKEISGYLISDKAVGAKLKHGTILWGMRTDDKYPIEYLSHFGLDLSGKVQSDIYYDFSRDNLMNSIDIVSCALGDTESWVKLSILGNSGENLVWQISGKNNTGLEITEKILSAGKEVTDSFSINGKRTLKGLTIFGDVVRLYNIHSSNVIFTNELGNKLLILIKANV